MEQLPSTTVFDSAMEGMTVSDEDNFELGDQQFFHSTRLPAETTKDYKERVNHRNGEKINALAKNVDELYVPSCDSTTIAVGKSRLPIVVAGKKRLPPTVIKTEKIPSVDDGSLSHRYRVKNLKFQEAENKKRTALLANKKIPNPTEVKTKIVPSVKKSLPDARLDLRLSDAMVQINAAQERKESYKKNIKMAYGGKITKPSGDRPSVGRIPKVSSDRLARLEETNRINKVLKERLLNVKATVSSFR